MKIYAKNDFTLWIATPPPTALPRNKYLSLSILPKKGRTPKLLADCRNAT